MVFKSDDNVELNLGYLYRIEESALSRPHKSANEIGLRIGSGECWSSQNRGLLLIVHTRCRSKSRIGFLYPCCLSARAQMPLVLILVPRATGLKQTVQSAVLR